MFLKSPAITNTEMRATLNAVFPHLYLSHGWRKEASFKKEEEEEEEEEEAVKKPPPPLSFQDLLSRRRGSEGEDKNGSSSGSLPSFFPFPPSSTRDLLLPLPPPTFSLGKEREGENCQNYPSLHLSHAAMPAAAAATVHGGGGGEGESH